MVLFEGTLRITQSVVGFGVAAFVGYVGVAVLLRYGALAYNEHAMLATPCRA